MNLEITTGPVPFVRGVVGLTDPLLQARSVEIAEQTAQLLETTDQVARTCRADDRYFQTQRDENAAAVLSTAAKHLWARRKAALDDWDRRIGLQEGLTLAPQVRHGTDVNESDVREVRAMLRTLDPTERMVKYLEAITNNDPVAIRAVELAPQMFPVLTKQAAIVAEQRERYAQLHLTAEYQRLQEMRRVRQFMTATAHMAIEYLVKQGAAIPDTDWAAEQVGGSVGAARTFDANVGVEALKAAGIERVSYTAERA